MLGRKRGVRSRAPGKNRRAATAKPLRPAVRLFCASRKQSLCISSVARPPKAMPLDAAGLAGRQESSLKIAVLTKDPAPATVYCITIYCC